MTSTRLASLFLTIFLAVMGYLIGIGTQLTDLGLNPVHIKGLIAVFTILLGIGNSINAVLITFGMNTSNTQQAFSNLPLTTQIKSVMFNANINGEDNIKKIETTNAIANSPELAANDKVVAKV